MILFLEQACKVRCPQCTDEAEEVTHLFTKPQPVKNIGLDIPMLLLNRPCHLEEAAPSKNLHITEKWVFTSPCYISRVLFVS